MWFVCSGAKREMTNNPNYYRNILCYYPNNTISLYEKQIEIDLPRTFPTDEYYSQTVIRKMKNILLAFSRRNISIGYCQGFNFIVGRLLKVIPDEEEAFWTFTQMIEILLPQNYFINMVGVMIDCTLFTEMLKSIVSELSDYIIENRCEVMFTNLIYKWFLSLFSQSISESVNYDLYSYVI
jgi:hypothetical protein